MGQVQLQGPLNYCNDCRVGDNREDIPSTRPQILEEPDTFSAGDASNSELSGQPVVRIAGNLRLEERVQNGNPLDSFPSPALANVVKDASPQRARRKPTTLQGLGKSTPILFSEFMTGFTELVWPYVARTLTKSFNEKVESALGEAVEKFQMLARFRDTMEYTCKFCEEAQDAFSFSEIYSYKKHPSLDEGIEICGLLEWSPNMVFNMKIGPISMGMDKMTIRGVGCGMAKPLLEQDPVLGGAQVFFCDMPELDLKFTGMGGMGGWEKVHEMMMQVCHDTFKKMFVLPNRFSLRFSNTYIHDWPSYRCPAPMGLLRVHLIGGDDLIAADVNFFSPNTSDPYCVLSLSGKEFKSRVIQKTTNPVWDPDKDFFDFWVFHERQSLQLSVYDQDVLKKDDLLGSLEDGCTVYELLNRQREQGRFGIRLPLDTTGYVRIGLSYISFLYKDAKPAGTCPSVISVKIYHIHGLPAELAKGAVIRATLASASSSEEATSKKSKGIHPKEFWGFGKRQCDQMNALFKSGSSVESIAAAFGLDPEVVEETLAYLNKTDKAMLRFGWDESIHLKGGAQPDSSLRLEIKIKDKWYNLGEPQSKAAVSSDRKRVGDKWQIQNLPDYEGWVGISIIRTQGLSVSDTVAIARFAIGRFGGVCTREGGDLFNRIRSGTNRPETVNLPSNRSRMTSSFAGSELGVDDYSDDSGSEDELNGGNSYAGAGMKAVSREIKRSHAVFDWSDNFDS